MKDLVVGAIANYRWQTIEPWVVSLERSGYMGQKAAIVHNVAPDVIDQLVARGFYVKNVAHHSRFFTVDRFFSLWQLLSETGARYVISTDTRDVVFQTNPSIWLEEHLPPFRLNVGSECLAYKDEPWNNQNMWMTYEAEVYAWMREKTVYNAGTIAGEAGTMRDLALN